MQVQLKKHWKEDIIYLALWTILFIAPLLSTYIDYTGSNDTSFPFPDSQLLAGSLVSISSETHTLHLRFRHVALSIHHC